MDKKKLSLICSGLLLLTAMIWGLAFVAQSVGMKYVGPWTFVFIRFLIGAIALYPLTAYTERLDQKRYRELYGKEKDKISFELSREKIAEYWKKKNITGGMICGILLGIASYLQQFGIQFTTVGKAGFITSLYVVLVPIFGIFMGKVLKKEVGISVFLAMIGLYLISMSERLTIEFGDLIVLISAFAYAFQILCIDYFTKNVNPVRLSNIQFLFAAVVAGIGMVFTESPSFSSLMSAAIPILYAGIFSTAIGYTFQIIAQKYTDPAVASILMSMESVFSALFGFIILGQLLNPRELTGCIVMFGAVILAQVDISSISKKKRSKKIK